MDLQPKGKTTLVTDSTAGIGLATAARSAREGAVNGLACRALSAGTTAIQTPCKKLI